MKSKQETITVDCIYTKLNNRKHETVAEDSKQVIEVRTFNDVPTCSVNMVGGLVTNLGNYDSARVSVSVTVPSYLEEIDEAFTYASSKVDEYLAPTLEEFVGMLKERGIIHE